MSEAWEIAPRSSKVNAAQSCSENNSCELRRKFFRVVAEIVSPNKPAEGFAAITGESVRSCNYWLSGERLPPLTAFVALLWELVRKLA